MHFVPSQNSLELATKVTTGAVELLLCGDPYRGLGDFGKSNVGEMDTPNIGLVIC